MSEATDILNKLDEKTVVTLQNLVNGAELVQPGIKSKSQNVKVDLKSQNEWKGTKSIIFVGEGEKDYKPKVRFYGVSGKPNTKRTSVRVDCNCSSYYFYFSMANFKAGAHEGPKDKVYVPVPDDQRKRKPGPPKNPDSIPGLCKHLYRFVNNLIDSGYVDD